MRQSIRSKGGRNRVVGTVTIEPPDTQRGVDPDLRADAPDLCRLRILRELCNRADFYWFYWWKSWQLSDVHLNGSDDDWSDSFWTLRTAVLVFP